MLVGVLSIVPLRQFFAQRGQVAELERNTVQLREANARLEERVEQLSDPEELERLARECLGMVRPGETAYVTVPKHGEAPPADC
jgi:cell division protein FtsB